MKRQSNGFGVCFYLWALILTPLNIIYLLYSEVIRYAGHPTTLSFFYNVFFWFCLLLLLNSFLRRFVPFLALKQSELLGLYVLLGITSGLAGHDTVEVLLPIISYPFHYADAANNWAETLLPHLPKWLLMTDKDALEPFFNGHNSLYTDNHWRAWLLPSFLWSLFLGTLAATMLCLNVLLLRQWTQRERLAFPLVQLPLELSDPQTTLWRNRLLWAGIAVAVLLQLWNGISYLYPTLPMLPIKYQDFGTVFKGRPWGAIGWLPIGFYPFAIALGVLLPTELTFSTWFFFWFWKGQNVVSSAAGWDTIPGFPYEPAQSLGAYLGIAVTALWGARRPLIRAFNRIFEGKQFNEDDVDAPIRTKFAAIGILIGIALLYGFCTIAGMTPWVIIAFFVVYFGIAIGVTRMRAELGAPIHDAHESGPHLVLTNALGPSNLGRGNLTMFAMFHGFNRAYRGHPMPIQMEGFKIAERSSSNSTVFFRLMLIAGFVGPMVAFWLLLHLGYQYGAAAALGPPNVLTIFGKEGWQYYDNWTKSPRPPQAGVSIAVVVGFAFALLLQLLRVRVIGFPFHPVGYAIASSWGMSILWVPMLLAWAFKSLTLRYGGLRAYRRVLPFFYGVIIGECVTGSLWTLLSLFTGIPTYGFWP